MSLLPAISLIRRFIGLATSETDAKTHPLIIQSTALQWLSEGYREIVRRAAVRSARVHQAEFIGDLAVAATQTGPSDCLDHLVIGDKSLMLAGSGGQVSGWPNLRSWNYMRDRHGAFSATAGPAAIQRDWCFDQRTAGALVIQPAPSEAVTDGLILDYVKDPGDLSLIYDDDTATVSVTNGSTTWTFASSMTGLIDTNCVIGVKASASELPTRWYRVASVSGLTVETTEAYAGTTSASALFTASEVSAVELLHPGLCAYAPVFYALFQYFTMQEGGEAAVGHMAAFDADIERIIEVVRHSQLNEVLPSPKAQDISAALR